ncbi:MAG: hypothetical protein KGI37_07820 [Alphaproteobacteria bacterium]|nr:hypothetical protein [Alphaproteobacteria bacterium]
MHILFAVMGCFFRRWWGGWHVPAHWVKIVVGYALSFFIGLFYTGDLLAAAGFGAVIGSAFLNPFHSWGMGMGFDNSGKSTWACAGVMGGSYGAYTTLAAVLMWSVTGDAWQMLYAVAGFLVPLPYILAWLVYRKWPALFHLPLAGVLFIDSPTAVGECCLGMLLFGV